MKKIVFTILCLSILVYVPSCRNKNNDGKPKKERELPKREKKRLAKKSAVLPSEQSEK